MTKMKLDALMFSMSEYGPITNWAEKNSQDFDVEMPTGVACASLANVIHEPEIRHSNSDGVLIADHKLYSDSNLRTVVRFLRDRHKSLYAVSHDTEPITRVASDQQSREIHKIEFSNTPILKLLFECRPALCFLNENGPTQVIPKNFVDQVNRLEKLGFVFKRNRKTFELRRQRLRKVLEHESKLLSNEYRLADLLNAGNCAGSNMQVRSIA